MRAWTSSVGIAVLVLTLPSPARAQTRSQAYVSVGAGATQLDGGIDWLIASSPVGVYGEVGAGNLFLAALGASYHPIRARARTRWRRYDPFATVGFTTVTDLNYRASGVSVGGGITYWPRARVGLRLDGFAFLPVRDDIGAFSENTSPHYWGVRVGIAFNLS